MDATEQPDRDIDTVMDGIGPRLRNLRRTRTMTLANLAQATGTSQATLSRLESGARRPSLDLLLRLARTYRVTLDELVDAPDTGDPRIHARPSVRYGMTWVPLTRRPGGLQAYKLIIPVGFPRGEPEPRSHQGYEWIYVLNRTYDDFGRVFGVRRAVLWPNRYRYVATNSVDMWWWLR